MLIVIKAFFYVFSSFIELLTFTLEWLTKTCFVFCFSLAVSRRAVAAAAGAAVAGVGLALET